MRLNKEIQDDMWKYKKNHYILFNINVLNNRCHLTNILTPISYLIANVQSTLKVQDSQKR